MNNFTDAINRAKARNWPEGARRMELERRMASALVKACIDRGFRVTVDNGEDKPVVMSTNYRKVMNALWQTDEEYVVLHDATGKRYGWFFLVYGNSGWDLVSDYTVNAVCEAIWNEVITPLADKMEEGK
jgi:hypothetical protein